jgi:O-antigen ligase
MTKNGKTVLAVVSVSAAAVAVGVLTVLNPGAAAAVAAALALIAVLSSMRSPFPPVGLDGKRFRWIPFAWAFMLLPIGHFSTGRTTLTAVSGQPSVENLINLLGAAMIAALSLWSMRRNRIPRQPSLLVLALPALATVSAAWSLAPNVTLGFSFMLVATVLLAAVTAAIMSADPEVGRSVVQRTLRVLVQVVAALCVLGLIFRHGWLTTPHEAPRFTWPGGHPLVAAAVIGSALLILVFARRREIGFSGTWRVALIALFSICLYLANSRTAFAGLAMSGLFGCWFISKASGPARRLMGALVIAAAVFLIVTSFGGPITNYLYRGESQQQVYSLNGRLGLWTYSLDQLHWPGRALFGYGLGGSRVILPSVSTWSGGSHSAWLEVLLSLGVVGGVAAAALVTTLAVRLLRAPPGGRLASRVLPVLFIFVLTISLTGSYGAPGPYPGLGFGVLCLCYAATARRQRALSSIVARHRPQVEGELRPVPI